MVHLFPLYSFLLGHVTYYLLFSFFFAQSTQNLILSSSLRLFFFFHVFSVTFFNIRTSYSQILIFHCSYCCILHLSYLLFISHTLDFHLPGSYLSVINKRTLKRSNHILAQSIFMGAQACAAHY